MRTTFDAEADAAYMQLVPEITPGRSVRNEIVETAGGTVVLDFDHAGVLLGAENLLDGEFLAGAERIDQAQA